MVVGNFSLIQTTVNSALNSAAAAVSLGYYSLDNCPLSQSFKIFVVEDDSWYSELLVHHLTLNPDYEVIKFTNARECLAQLHQQPSVITLDYSLPDMNGAEVLKKILAFNPNIQVVIISAQENITTAIDLLKKGAYDYIVKDDDARNRLWSTVNNIRKNLLLKEEVEHLREEIGQRYDFSKAIIGSSESMKRVFNMMDKAARTHITVSLSGETGTGKELVAKAIHYNSTRNLKPFLPVNVASIPRDLIESELFGHEKGAFTGAISRRKGKFEEAHGGTLFLDEIAEMDITLQVKLLRVLQEKEITRVGSNAAVPIDVRIIVATHKNLAEETRKGNFREDLYYRLLGLPIHLPPLRERNNDVLLIAKHLIEDFCKANSIKHKTLSTEAQKKLLAYPFPGNVRELKAIVELAVVMSDEETILPEAINFTSSNSTADLFSKEMTLDEYTGNIIRHYLNKHDNNVLKVAEKLKVGKSTIYRLLKEGKV